MLPKMLATKDRFGSYIYDGTGLLVAVVDVGDDIEIIAELVRRWNAFEAMGEALRNGHSLLRALTGPDDQIAQATLSAMAAYLPADQRATLRGQNVDETA